MQVIDGYNATGIMDEITGMLEEGYAVLDRDENDQIISEAYFGKGYTDFYIKGQEPYRIEISALIHCLFQLCTDLMQSAHLAIQESAEHA